MHTILLIAEVETISFLEQSGADKDGGESHIPCLAGLLVFGFLPVSFASCLE